MRRSRITRICILLGVVLIGIASATGRGRQGDKENRAKARYYYLKGNVSEAEGNTDQAYDYYKKAFQSDPAYTNASYSFGELRMMLDEDTFFTPTEQFRNLEYMRRHIDAYPADVEAGEEYAYYAAINDTLPEAIRIYNNLVKIKPGLSRLYLPRSYYYFNSGKPDSAVMAIRELERLEGATTETTLRKVTYWVTSGDTLSALNEARKYVEANPGKSEPIVDMAMIYNLLGRQDSAVIFLEDALKLFPDKSELKFDIAMLSAERGDSARFHTLVAEAFRGEDLEYEDRMQMLGVYTQKLNPKSGSFAESDRLYEYAASLFPEDADFFDYYADYEVLKGDYAGALQQEQKALQLNQKEPSFLGRTVSFSILAGKPEIGIKEYEKFTDTETKNKFNLLLIYVSALQSAKEYDRALSYTDTLLTKLSPDFSLNDEITEEKVDSFRNTVNSPLLYGLSTVYEIAGDIYAKKGMQKEAIKSYENSIVLDPQNNASVLNNYAYYLVETVKVAPGTPEFEKAKEMSRKSIELTEENPQSTYYDTYAWILFKEGNYKDALNYQELAIESEEDEVAAEMWSHYGDILFMNGRPEEALEQWKKALKLEPDDTLLKRKVEHKTFFYE